MALGLSKSLPRSSASCSCDLKGLHLRKRIFPTVWPLPSARPRKDGIYGLTRSLDFGGGGPNESGVAVSLPAVSKSNRAAS
jgi:hypothetical protein